MITIPENFELFSDVWIIRSGTDKELETDLGRCYPDSQEILLRPDQTAQQISHVLLHEIIHAVETRLNLDLTEAQVDGVALGLRHLFRHNPQLCRAVFQPVEADTDDRAE